MLQKYIKLLCCPLLLLAAFTTTTQARPMAVATPLGPFIVTAVTTEAPTEGVTQRKLLSLIHQLSDAGALPQGIGIGDKEFELADFSDIVFPIAAGTDISIPVAIPKPQVVALIALLQRLELTGTSTDLFMRFVGVDELAYVATGVLVQDGAVNGWGFDFARLVWFRFEIRFGKPMR